MEEDHSTSLINVDLELLSVLLQNPFLSRPEDEIGETALVKWVEREYKSCIGTTVKKQDVYGLITKLILEGVFVGKRYGQKMLLKPTHNYYLLKDGRPMVQKKRAKTPVSLFADSADCLCVRKTELSEVNETEDLLLDADEMSTPRQFSSNSVVPYSHHLLEKIRQYKGPDKDLVKYLPAFFSLACNILNDKYTDWHTKVLISSALGYFVLENDVIPDHTEFGYLDDLYLLSYVLREIKRHVSPSLLDDNWEYSEDIHELIEVVYRDTYIVVQDYACEILHKVGLRKFKELELEEYSGTYPQKIAKLAQEKRELIALTAYLIKMVYRTDFKGRDLKRIKDFLMQYGDYTEIARLIELSNRDYATEEAVTSSVESFEADLERKLQQARLNALFED
ncbi:MAG: YkvA family protein [Candidatus Methanoculleus thermohydrogenotrophicum]